MEGSFSRAKGNVAGSNKGDVTYESIGAAKSKNCYPNKAQHQVNRSLNAVIKDKGNNCAIKIKITTSLMKLRLNPKKLPAYKQSEET